MQKIGKEVKIGLAVIGVLLVAFGYVLVKRLAQPGDATASASSTDDAAATGDQAAAGAGPRRPTVISATEPDHTAEAAGRPKASPWTIRSDHQTEASDAKGTDPGADSKNPFSMAPREAGASAGQGASLFARNENAVGASSRFDDPRRHEGKLDGARRDDSASPGTVQASDVTPLAPAGTEPSAAAEPRSIFAKSAADKSSGEDRTAAGDEGYGGDKSPAADPFQRRSADGAAAVNPFDRRSAESANAAAPLQPKSADSAPDTRNAAGQSFADRHSIQPKSLTPVENPGLKPTGLADEAAEPRNPLRRSADADAQPTGGAADAGNRFPSQNRFGQTDAAATSPVVPAREGGAFDPASRLDAGIATTPGSSRWSGPASVPQPLVADDAAAKPGQYIVQPNDNYWTISEKVYGAGGYFKAIFEHNRRQHPKAERLQVGEVLLVPDITTLQKNYPDLCPKPAHAAAPQRTLPASARIRPGTKVYVVEEGDTLFKIAKDQLGNPSKWAQIYELNREVIGKDNYDYLKPGMELLVPAGDNRPDPIARQPGGTISQ